MTANQTMNLFHNFIKNSLFPSLSWVRALFNQRQSYIPHLSIIPFTLYLLLSVSLLSCIDETFPSSQEDLLDNSLVEVDLPGIFGVNLSQNEDFTTRADNSESTSDNKKFQDGIESEYALATPSGNEYYHYLLLYEKSVTNGLPMIFPIDVENKTVDSNQYNNLTLTIKKILSTDSSNIDEKDSKIEKISSVTDLENYLKSCQAYVFLNFKLDDKALNGKPNYSLNGDVISGDGTVKKLSGLKMSDLESIQMLDYKITAPADGVDKNYLIMTNAVYYTYDGSSKIIDYSVLSNNGDKIFSDPSQAENNPAISVYVERIASKVTVSFDMSSMEAVGHDFGPDDKQYITRVSAGEKGLPEISLKVMKVAMDRGHDGGIQFDTNGYKILTDEVDATIRILGYGLSNVETSTNLVKNFNYLTSTSWKFNDPDNHRSYWAQDQHYTLTYGTGKYTRMSGYPHQFRLALDSDTVTSMHAGLDGGYLNYEDYLDEYYVGKPVEDNKYYAYNKLGTIDYTKYIDGINLKYKSFQNLMDEFNNLGYTTSSFGDENQFTSYQFNPMYTFENTYLDPGMIGNSWRWRWQRAPYAIATNLMLMAEIIIADNTDTSGNSSGNSEIGQQPGEEENPMGDDSKTRGFNILTRDGDISPRASSVRTVYLGQNNIFYLNKWNLLYSKLTILNKVMLSGGNAGIQILHGQWDQHKRWDENKEDDMMASDDEDSPHLDKIAWNEGSVLWFAETETNEDGETPKYEPVATKDDKGNTITTYKVVTKTPFKVTINRSSDQDAKQHLTLIPAELSGGDGQALIAPGENYMGMRWRYFLAPPEFDETGDVKIDEQGKEVMDTSKAVEISYNHLVALIHKIIGPVDVYTEGKMYFNVPIPHRYNNNTTNQNWQHVGGYSLVRNNWYNIVVNQLTRLGTSVDDLNQPIVPVMDVKRSYINMGVKLLDWHQITQDNIPMM